MSVEGDAGTVGHSSGVRRLEGTRRIADTHFDFEGWKITVLRSPILPSNCYCSTLDAHNTIGIGLEINLDFAENPSRFKCQVCRYSEEVKLKHYPEMVFPDNLLHLVYKPSGFILDFNTLDAMKIMSTQDTDSVRVACAEAWQASKTEMGLPKEVHHDFNWTFTTEYHGTIKTKDVSENSPSIVTDPPEKLNLEKLMQREKILFYEELTLYEDELHDNGISNLSVKIRVMPSGFFILLRYYLRVDHVMAKVCDTRIHFETGNQYFLRQLQIREESFKNLSTIDPHIFTDINLLYPHLPVTREVTEKILIT